MDETKKTYKDFDKVIIGCSDIASLIVVGGYLEPSYLVFGEDGDYSAYIIDDPNIVIPDHYHKQFTCKEWLKIYDDDELMYKVYGDEIEIYRAGERECIIRIINRISD